MAEEKTLRGRVLLLAGLPLASTLMITERGWRPVEAVLERARV
jgi:hypothetical protein